MAKDIWTGIGEAASAPLKIAGAIREGYYDPYGSHRKLQEQSLLSNDLAIAVQKMKLLQEFGITAINDDQSYNDYKQAFAMAVEEDPVLKQFIGGGRSGSYLDNLRAQAIKAQDLQATDEAAKQRKDLFSFITGSNYPNLPEQVQDTIAGSMVVPAGLGPLNPANLRVPSRDYQSIDTVDAGGNPVTSFMPKADIIGQTFPKYQTPNYDLVSAPDVPPMAIDMNRPGAAPITTALPAGSTRMGTPQTNIKIGGDETPIEADVSKIALEAKRLTAQDPAFDYTPKYNPTKGGYYLEPTPKKIPDQAEREAKAKNEQAQRKIALMEQYIDFSKIGPIQGNWTKLKTAIGFGTLDESRLKVQMRSNIEQLYATAGKQVAVQEMDRVMSFMPVDISKSDNDFMAQWELFLFNVKETGQITDEEWQKLGFKQLDFAGGRKAIREVQQAKKHPTITNDDEFDALPSGSMFYGPDGKFRRKP